MKKPQIQKNEKIRGKGQKYKESASNIKHPTIPDTHVEQIKFKPFFCPNSNINSCKAALQIQNFKFLQTNVYHRSWRNLIFLIEIKDTLYYLDVMHISDYLEMYKLGQHVQKIRNKRYAHCTLSKGKVTGAVRLDKLGRRISPHFQHPSH